MKDALLFITIVCLLSACNRNDDTPVADTNVADSIPVIMPTQLQMLCFQLVSGGQKRDTSTVNLVLNGNRVTGRMKVAIWEKDSRVGVLNGSKQDNKVMAVWTYMQEGMMDSMEVHFQLTDTALLRKPNMVNPIDGREELNKGAAYSIIMPKAGCASTKYYAANGKVTAILQGKDGVTASLTTSTGEQVEAVISRNRLQNTYIQVAEGDSVQVAGDTIVMEGKVYVQVETVHRP